MKKAWQVPQLIVLVRSKPEEAVLGACKTFFGTPGPITEQQQCVFTNIDLDCQVCETSSTT